MMMQYEFEQMQDCITALFDCFERVQLDGQPLQHSLRKLIEQNISFARKMVELSEKFDELYSKQTQQLSEEVYRAVKRLYALLPGHRKEGVEVVPMLEAVAEELNRRNQSSQNSRHNANLRDSKRSRGRSETQNNQPVTRTNRKVSSGKTITLKEALTLKRSLQEEQQSIRQLFSSLQQLLADAQMPIPQSEKYKYQKHYAQQEEAVSALTLVKGNIDSNATNLQRLRGLLGTTLGDLLKHMRKNGGSNSRIGLYLAQIEKRQEAFSYTISKILESFRSLGRTLEGRSQTRSGLQNLEELLNKLFDIYPSADLLKDIHPTSPQAKQRKVQDYIGNSKEVQVNIKPKENKEVKKQQIELFRLGVRLNQWLKRVFEAIRYKKQVDARDLEKWLDNLKESTATINEGRSGAGKEAQAEMAAFDEEYRRIQAETDAREAELKAEYERHIVKLEKAIRSQESQFDQLRTQLVKAEEKHSKLQKKFDNEKQEVSKLKSQKDSLGETIYSLQQQLEKLRSNIKTQQKEQSKQTKIARSEQELIAREKEKIEDELRRLTRSLEDKQLSVEQERAIYKSKIKLIEEREQEIKTENERLKVELEAMIGDNKVLKERVEHMGQLYEQKIKQCEELIEEFRKTEDELAQRQLECREAKVELTSLKESVTQLDQELSLKTEECGRVMQDKLKAEDNARKYRDLGRLNEEDIQMLKQEIEKVKNAYFEAEEQLAAMKDAYELLTEEKLALTDAKHKYSEMLEDMEGDLDEHKRFRDRSEEAIRITNQELQTKERQLNELAHQLEISKDDRKELVKYKKENAELRSNLSTLELQVETLKHDMKNASLLQEASSSQEKKDLKAINSKYQVELETLRIELKHSKDTVERDRAAFERQRGLLQQKITDLKTLLNEKESLASRLKLARHYESLQGSESKN